MVHPREILYHKNIWKGKLANNFPGKTPVYLLRARGRPTRATATQTKPTGTTRQGIEIRGTRAAEESTAWLAIGRIRGRDGGELTSADGGGSTGEAVAEAEMKKRQHPTPWRAHPSLAFVRDEGAEESGSRILEIDERFIYGFWI